jgi:hypothetical protein
MISDDWGNYNENHENEQNEENEQKDIYWAKFFTWLYDEDKPFKHVLTLEEKVIYCLIVKKRDDFNRASKKRGKDYFKIINGKSYFLYKEEDIAFEMKLKQSKVSQIVNKLADFKLIYIFNTKQPNSKKELNYYHVIDKIPELKDIQEKVDEYLNIRQKLSDKRKEIGIRGGKNSGEKRKKQSNQIGSNEPNRLNEQKIDNPSEEKLKDNSESNQIGSIIEPNRLDNPTKLVQESNQFGSKNEAICYRNNIKDNKDKNKEKNKDNINDQFDKPNNDMGLEAKNDDPLFFNDDDDLLNDDDLSELIESIESSNDNDNIDDQPIESELFRVTEMLSKERINDKDDNIDIMDCNVDQFVLKCKKLNKHIPESLILSWKQAELNYDNMENFNSYKKALIKGFI